ncbi:unnamed protein product [Anisakis simplex]|uniref:Uncharacterized protein n=1 Tax=Anisakis simplex TaxID=6269 RepID=A0A0M3JD49_ANISI|nr:unnamed protein product [Anisakis simplex]
MVWCCIRIDDVRSAHLSNKSFFTSIFIRVGLEVKSNPGAPECTR